MTDVVGLFCLLWLLGWVCCSVVYVVFAVKKEKAPLLSVFGRILLLGCFWPVYVVILPFIFLGRSEGNR